MVRKVIKTLTERLLDDKFTFLGKLPYSLKLGSQYERTKKKFISMKILALRIKISTYMKSFTTLLTVLMLTVIFMKQFIKEKTMTHQRSRR